MDSKKMQGYESPDDKKVPIQVGYWNAQKLALWRSKVAWEIAERAAEEILERCEHVDSCLARVDETKPCAPDCPDRETWMSALVILSAARQFAPVSATKLAKAPYYAPSREHFSEVLAELAAAQAELETLRGTVVTLPPANKEAP
jgi:hypothetical protein